MTKTRNEKGQLQTTLEKKQNNKLVSIDVHDLPFELPFEFIDTNAILGCNLNTGLLFAILYIKKHIQICSEQLSFFGE